MPSGVEPSFPRSYLGVSWSLSITCPTLNIGRSSSSPLETPDSDLRTCCPAKMSYYFTILSPTDTPIFNIAFGTSKGGGDGIARFRFPDTAQYMNQFIIHSSLDIVEEAQWTNGGM